MSADCRYKCGEFTLQLIGFPFGVNSSLKQTESLGQGKSEFTEMKVGVWSM